jgi:hypothetical protein
MLLETRGRAWDFLLPKDALARQLVRFSLLDMSKHSSRTEIFIDIDLLHARLWQIRVDRSGRLDFDDSGGKIVTGPLFGRCCHGQPVDTFLGHTGTRSNPILCYRQRVSHKTVGLADAPRNVGNCLRL